MTPALAQEKSYTIDDIYNLPEGSRGREQAAVSALPVLPTVKETFYETHLSSLFLS